MVIPTRMNRGRILLRNIGPIRRDHLGLTRHLDDRGVSAILRSPRGSVMINYNRGPVQGPDNRTVVDVTSDTLSAALCPSLQIVLYK